IRLERNVIKSGRCGRVTRCGMTGGGQNMKGFFGAVYRRRVLTVGVVALAVAATAFFTGAVGAPATPDCATASTLSGSKFEFITDGNLKVDGSGDCIDWLADGSGSTMRAGVLTKPDLPTGTSD